jgi:site-specific DNA-methyltransferase (adenine-specific)
MRKETIGEATLYLADCLEVIPTLADIDAVVTDPPYSSGGSFRSDRVLAPSRKYVANQSLETVRIEFSGDNRDQRSFLTWASIWLSMLLRASKPGATLYAFTDWRQLPTMTDAVQCGGWTWRNLVTWWKPGVRMQRGRFSLSSEYIVCASVGVPNEGEKSPQNVLQFAPVASEDKEHIAEKPVALLEAICGTTPPGALVVDPFMGAGTTGVACAGLGRRFVGVEVDSHAFDVACKRIDAAYAQRRLFP